MNTTTNTTINGADLSRFLDRYSLEYIDDKASIARSVCSLLNKEGGIVWCVKRNGSFEKYEDAAIAGKSVYESLRRYISNFSFKNVKVTIGGNNKKYFVAIQVKKSAYIHVLKNSKAVIDFKGFNKDVFKKVSLISKSQIDESLNENVKKLAKVVQKLQETRISQKKVNLRKIEKYLEGYYKVGAFAGGNKFYKYMSMENVLQCFNKSNIRFVEPAKWQDKFENYFYGANIMGKKCSNSNPMLYATCLTNKRDSESAWKIYSYNTQGLASRCVELVINRLKFRKQLLKARIKEGNSKRYKLLSDLYDIYEGEVLYKDEVEILNLTKQRIKVNQKEVDNEIFDSYFNPFSFDSYLNLMLLKRNAFRHESEVRIFIVPKKWKDYTKDHSHIDLKIDWSDCIEGLRYDCHCSEFEKNMLIDAIKKVLKIKKNKPLPSDFKFEPYDVYQGPEPPEILPPSINIEIDINLDQLDEIGEKIKAAMDEKIKG